MIVAKNFPSRKISLKELFLDLSGPDSFIHTFKQHFIYCVFEYILHVALVNFTCTVLRFSDRFGAIPVQGLSS